MLTWQKHLSGQNPLYCLDVMLWFCVQFPFLGLELCLRGQQPASGKPASENKEDNSDRPMVLVEKGRVLACNAAATQSGIQTGCSLATAHSIDHRLVHCSRSPEDEQRRLAYLAETAYRYTPSVSIEAPDSLLLELEGSLKLFGSVYHLKRAMKQLFAGLSHRCVIAAGHTPAAALLFARAGYFLDLPAWPSTQDVQRAGLKALQPMNLRYSELPGETLERLANMGIYRVGQLLRLPKAELGRRFGPRLLEYLDQLWGYKNGQKSPPRVYISPAEQFENTLHLLESVGHREGLLFPMQRLVMEAFDWLISRQLGTRGLIWTFTGLNQKPGKRANNKRVSMRVRFAEPQREKKTLLEVSRLRLERLELPAEVITLRLDMAHLEIWKPRSKALFQQHQSMPGARPDELLDQLTARLGQESFCSIAPRNRHQPEMAWHKARPELKQRRKNPASKASHDLESRKIDRPLWLLRAPQSLNLRQITLLGRAERIECGWWQRRDRIARDYYIARHINGAYCWVYQEWLSPEAGRQRWFLHGYFS